MANLKGKQHLGLHTELVSDGLAELVELGVIDNSLKTINRGKAVASFCMGKKRTYDFIHDNPSFEFRSIDYTNNPLIIAQHNNMTAINSALEIDLTGQATAESIGKVFYSGIGGQADFMRGAVLARGGKTILTVQSTADDMAVSRIVPFLKEGAGVTLNRGDVHYVVTEYGIAHLHGKNIRERAMELIAIAHPKFRPWLVEEARKLNLIYPDQKIFTGEKGEYPEELETYRTTKTGLEVLLRPIRISDEPALRDLFHHFSDKSMYLRFISRRFDMPHDRLQEMVVIDYTRDMAILALLKHGGQEEVTGVGRYFIHEDDRTAEVAFEVKDEFQNRGVGQELLSHLTLLAQKRGLLGFTAEVLAKNEPMLHLFEKMGFDVTKTLGEGVYEMRMMFRPAQEGRPPL